jgi:hypothetical protein
MFQLKEMRNYNEFSRRVVVERENETLQAEQGFIELRNFLREFIFDHITSCRNEQGNIYDDYIHSCLQCVYFLGQSSITQTVLKLFVFIDLVIS